MIDSRKVKDVHKWCEQVAEGKIALGKYARLSVERHLKDLIKAKERGFYFDKTAAQHRLDFNQYCHHYKGEWAGRIIVPEMWQAFIQICIFGWKRNNGLRRFRTAWREVARGNGKTTDCAIDGLYLLLADMEPGSEVYSAATKRDQAKEVWGAARQMVKLSPMLSRYIKCWANNLSVEKLVSKFEPLGADADTMDGKRVHGAILDEVHAHKTSAVYDVLKGGTGTRREPLIEMITTAGFVIGGFGHSMHEYAEKVLEGMFPASETDSWFAWVSSLDEGDDGFDESVWHKANPNLHVSVKIDDLREKAKEALRVPALRNTFLVKHCNRWTNQSKRWIPIEKWDSCRKLFNWDDFNNKPCWAGLDLSTHLDLTAFVLLFEVDSGFAVKPFFFCPEANAEERSVHDRVPYVSWANDGHIITTPGNYIDYDFIEHHIAEMRKRFDLQVVAYDPWKASQLVSNLQEKHGINVLACGQGFKSFSEPSKKFEALVHTRKIQHDGHPVLRWNVSNVATKADPAGNIKPDKSTSGERIDGVAALIMALFAHDTVSAEDGFIYDKMPLYVS